MNRYTIPCTGAQTRKALELGAPIFTEPYFPQVLYEVRNFFVKGETAYCFPTAEQMRGYLLKEHGIFPVVDMTNSVSFEYGFVSMLKMENNAKRFVGIYPSNEEATLAAIDAALEHIIKNKKQHEKGTI